MEKETETSSADRGTYYIGHKDEEGRIQKLKDHLCNVGDLAGDFASAFQEADMGKLMGDYHDIGKYSKEFQEYIRRGTGRKVDHSTAGMQEFSKQLMIPAAFCIAGHHGGLPDGGSRNDVEEGRTFCAKSKRNHLPVYQDYLKENTPVKFIKPSALLTEIRNNHDKFAAMNYIRMLFSCLVDADFLDTEQFMSLGEVERGGFDSISVIKEKLDIYMDAHFSHPATAINKKRCDILQQCVQMGNQAKGGVYNLTVPTGGGKTIASLAFALHHAVSLHKRRIIYVIPYTSIIEQNAAVFSGIVGSKNVIEHHMNIDYDDLQEADSDCKRLATENWDAPVIVTTNVQFFESLFANRTSKCRKLHNIVNSVIIFDEAQMIPLEFLQPCMKSIEELVRHYQCTAVLCTATQPSLGTFFTHRSIQEICPHIVEDYQFFKRTTIRVLPEKLTEDVLAERLKKLTQVLCIVNTKKEARRLYEKVNGDKGGVYHLSTNLCAIDRSKKLAEIKERLQAGLPCKVISTSLIECGVDISVPVVYRELAGLDSIIQAAGRCNREGKQAAADSIVYVYTTDNTEKNGHMKQQRAVTQQVCHAYPEDISVPDAIAYYFDHLHVFQGEGLDNKEILKTIASKIMPFEEIAKKFILIDTPMRPVFIPDGEEAEKIAQRLRQGERSRALLRKAGQYSVNVYCGTAQQPFERLMGAKKIEVIDAESSTGISILLDMTIYDADTGLQTDIDDGQAVFF